MESTQTLVENKGVLLNATVSVQEEAFIGHLNFLTK